MPLIPQTPETNFQYIKRIMSAEPPTDFDPGELAPWGDREFEEFASQEPLPPNQPFQLNAEEPSRNI